MRKPRRAFRRSELTFKDKQQTRTIDARSASVRQKNRSFQPQNLRCSPNFVTLIRKTQTEPSNPLLARARQLRSSSDQGLVRQGSGLDVQTELCHARRRPRTRLTSSCRRRLSGACKAPSLSCLIQKKCHGRKHKSESLHSCAGGSLAGSYSVTRLNLSAF
jgi:hypothetical protein